MLWITLGIVLGNILTDIVRYAFEHRRRGLCWYIGHSMRKNACVRCQLWAHPFDDDQRWAGTMWA